MLGKVCPKVIADNVTVSLMNPYEDGIVLSKAGCYIPALALVEGNLWETLRDEAAQPFTWSLSLPPAPPRPCILELECIFSRSSCLILFFPDNFLEDVCSWIMYLCFSLQNMNVMQHAQHAQTNQIVAQIGS